MKKNVLITGGGGYIGSFLTYKLLKKNYNIRIIDPFWFSHPSLFAFAPKQKNLEVIKGDIRDKKLVIKALKDIDIVINLAAIANDPCADLNPSITKEINYDAVIQLTKLAQEHKIKRFINASSSSVYGVKKIENVTEDLKLKPITIYAKTKAKAEKFIRDRNSSKFTTVSVRSATVFGYSPRLRLDLTVNLLTAAALTKGVITVFGGTQKRPNIHIDDLTDLYALLVDIDKRKISGEVFNVGYENNTVMKIAEIIKKNLKHKSEIVVEPTFDNRSYHISSELVRRKTGFVPKRSIGFGVREIETYFNRGFVPDPENPRYYNIKTMKIMNIK